jgi:outer membrane protein assembly factor BamB
MYRYAFARIILGLFVTSMASTQRATPLHEPPATVDAKASTSGLARSPWPRYRGNAGNTGMTAAVSVGKSTPWIRETLGQHTVSDPAIGADGTVFVATDSLYALDGGSGNKRWEFHVPNAGGHSPVLGLNNALYFGGSFNYSNQTHDLLFCLDASSGRQRWSAPVDGFVRAVPVVAADGTVFVGTLKGWVYALDCVTGRQKWSIKTAHEIYGALALSAEGALYVPSDYLYALDPTTGKERWRCDCGPILLCGPTVGRDGTIYIQYGGKRGSQYNAVLAIAGDTGKRKWAFETGAGDYTSPCLAPNGTLYVGVWGSIDKSPEGFIYAIDSASGHRKWMVHTNTRVHSPTLGSDGTVFEFTENGSLVALNGANGAVKWRRDLGADVRAAPAIANGMIYFGTYDGQIYAVRERDGSTGPRVSEFTR